MSGRANICLHNIQFARHFCHHSLVIHHCSLQINMADLVSTDMDIALAKSLNRSQKKTSNDDIKNVFWEKCIFGPTL